MKMDIDDLAMRFQACAVPKAEWTHVAHLCVGLWHVHRYGAEEALTRLRSGIRRLNESHGNVNSDSSGYHETITVAYVRLLSQFLDRSPAHVALGDLVGELLESPLAARDVRLAFYTRERLMSKEARAGWVEPDVAPLDILALHAPDSGVAQGERRSIGDADFVPDLRSSLQNHRLRALPDRCRNRDATIRPASASAYPL